MRKFSSNEKKLSVAPDGMVYPIPNDGEINISQKKLTKRAETERAKGRKIVVVQGIGFVGACVAAVVANATNCIGQPLYFVIGVDLNSMHSYWKVAKINNGLPPVSSPDSELSTLIHNAVHKMKNLCATVSMQTYSLADVIVVDIPLGVLNRFVNEPSEISINLQKFEGAIQTIGRNMKAEALVLLETTVPFGTCEKVVFPILEKERTRRGINSPLYLAHASERVMPGPQYVKSIRQYWRSFSGISEESRTKARKFLSSFINIDKYPLWEIEDIAGSELGKLLENSYRAVNIAFIFEWTLLAEQIGIDLFKIIDSIRVRKGTHDNMRYPGFGVGGYCLPKDALLAQWSSTHLYSSDLVLGMTLSALETNNRMPLHIFDLLVELAENDLSGKTIAVCGVSYLPDVPDTRNSPAEILVNELDSAGAKVIAHDPYLIAWPEKPQISLIQDLNKCFEKSDGIVFAIPHQCYLNLPAAAILNTNENLPFVVDAQNVLTDEKAELIHRAGCRLLGVGKGHWRKRGYQWKIKADDRF